MDTPADVPVREIRTWARALGQVVRSNWLFAAALAAGGLLRLIAMLAYPGVLWFAGDSWVYLGETMRLSPDIGKTVGYPIMAGALEPLHTFVLVALLQHLMGLAMAVMIYALARLAGLPRWGSTLATLPVLLDAYQIQLEHLFMPDTLFAFLVVTAVALALWRDRPAPWVMLAAGLVTGYAVIVREAGLPLLVVLPVFFLIKWRGWLVPLALAAGCLAPVAAYAVWFHSVNGQYLLTRSTGFFLYGRTTSFADCTKINPPAQEQKLCLSQPLADRGPPGEFVWRIPNARKLPGGPVTVANNKLLTDFAVRAIEAQPFDYARAIARGLMVSVDWHRLAYPGPFTYGHYEFPNHPEALPADRSWVPGGTPASDALAYGRASPSRVVRPFSSSLRIYQRFFYTYGPLFGLLLAAGVAGIARHWRSRGGPGLLPWVVAMTLLVFPIAVTDFDYRYMLPTVPMASLAAALAFAPVRQRHGRDAPAAAVVDNDPKRLPRADPPVGQAC